MINILSLWDSLNKIADDFREWIFANYTNPLLWVGLLVGGFILYKLVASALSKD